MKKFMLFICALILLTGTAFDSNAELTRVTDSSGDRAIWDNVSGQYWYPDLADLTDHSYAAQKNAIASLRAWEYFGINDWHMASYDEMVKLWNNPDYEIIKFDSTGTDSEGREFWSGRFDYIPDIGGWPEPYHATASVIYLPGDPGGDLIKSDLGGLIISDNVAGVYLGAWVVSGTPVPEPATLFLLSACLVGLAGFGRKKFKG